MGRIVIACYKPKPGRKEELIQLTHRHVKRLRAEGLVTDREPIAMEAEDGTIVEIFEWKSKDAIEAAHSSAVVEEMWREYAEICDYVPIGELKEAGQMFSEFSPLQL